MIGYRFKQGAVVLGIAPSGDSDSYIVLCKYGPEDHWQYVTGRVYVRQLPAPEGWDNGSYSTTVEQAVKDWIRRTCLAKDDDGVEWLVRLIENTEKALAPPRDLVQDAHDRHQAEVRMDLSPSSEENHA